MSGAFKGLALAMKLGRLRGEALHEAVDQALEKLDPAERAFILDEMQRIITRWRKK